jgi:hypothetical protein
MYDLLESRGDLGNETWDDFELVQELNLHVSTDELLSASRAFTYADLYAMLGNEDTMAWLTPHTAVARIGERVIHSWGKLEYSCILRFIVDGNDMVALARSPEHILEICYVVVRLLAASVVHSVCLRKWSRRSSVELINAPTLAYLMEQCQSLKVLSLYDLEMDESHCRALGAFSRPDLEINLDGCKLTSAGATALAEVLGRNQGPTKLAGCHLDYYVLADGLRGNSRLKSLTPRLSNNLEDDNRKVLAIAGALRENKGLVSLDLSDINLNDETWGAICDSLKTHPTLEVLNLHAPSNDANTTAPAVIPSRIEALLDMVKVNFSIHTIHLHVHYKRHELFRGSVFPCLETNRFRPRVRAIQKTRPIAYRAMVLGRALLAVRTDPNRFWMLLSENADVAFPSTTATTTAAARLPTPASVAATVNVAPGSATGSTTAASNVVAPAAGQKRKPMN